MKKNFLLAAGMMFLASCACQSNDSEMKNDNKQMEDDSEKSNGGCCEMKKIQEAPLSEQKAAAPAPVQVVPEAVAPTVAPKATAPQAVAPVLPKAESSAP